MGPGSHHIRWVYGTAPGVRPAPDCVSFYSIVGAQHDTMGPETAHSGNGRAARGYVGSNSQLLRDRRLSGLAPALVCRCAGRLERSTNAAARVEDCTIRGGKIGSSPGTWSGFQGEVQ
jgi:hypothetical protein